MLSYILLINPSNIFNNKHNIVGFLFFYRTGFFQFFFSHTIYISGTCVKGDFNNPHVNCTEVLSTVSASWAYAQCPDVDECGLGLDDCHPEAVCTNTDGSFSCHCRKGYRGDGRTSCVKTCYNVCVHGVCQDKGDYTCKCDLGWYGDDCSKNCGCNNHSSCPRGEGICEQCQNWTMGEHCELCMPGSYGNATSEQGKFYVFVIFAITDL